MSKGEAIILMAEQGQQESVNMVAKPPLKKESRSISHGVLCRWLLAEFVPIGKFCPRR